MPMVKLAPGRARVDWIGSGCTGVERLSNGLVPAATSLALLTPSPSKSAPGRIRLARWKPVLSPPHAEPPLGTATSTSELASTCQSLIAFGLEKPNTQGSPLPSIDTVVNEVLGGRKVFTITPFWSTLTQLPAKPWLASQQ